MWRLAEDTITQEDLDALADWLRGGPRLTQGELVREFERRWAEWVGTSEAVYVSSGSTANFMLVDAVAKRVQGPKVRIGLAAATWPTNITPSMYLGHELVFFDIDRSTLAIDSAAAIDAIKSGAIDILFVTHLLGFCGLSVDVIEAANRHGVILIEDCCEAHGANLDGDRVGSLSLAGTFSFYFGHHMSTIEGGMINTNDSRLADDLRLIRSHGLAREVHDFPLLAAQNPEIDERFLFVTRGLNFRSTDLNAFLGLRQLDQIDDRIKLRNDNLFQFLAQAPDHIHRDYRLGGISSFALPLLSNRYPASALRSAVTEAGIESRPVVAGNLLRQPFLRHEKAFVYGGALKNTDWLHDNGLYVGNGHHVTTAMINLLTDTLMIEDS